MSEAHQIERMKAWAAFMAAAMHNVSQWEAAPHVMADKALEAFDERFPAPTVDVLDHRYAGLCVGGPFDGTTARSSDVSFDHYEGSVCLGVYHYEPSLQWIWRPAT